MPPMMLMTIAGIVIYKSKCALAAVGLTLIEIH